MAVIPKLQRSAFFILRRNIGFSAILAQKGQAVDPVQKLFIQKIKEYEQKAKANPGKLVDSNPAIEKELKAELERVAKIFGGGQGVDMTKLPALDFPEPKLDPINQVAAK